MAYWLIKSEPTEYSFERLQQEGEVLWTGVRNYQARNALKEMRPGEYVLFYHSGDDKEIVGVAQVASVAEPDPTADTDAWVAVRIKPVCPVGRTLGIEEIKVTHGLSVMLLATQSRLSVQPVTEQQWNDILKYTKTALST